ncbi:MAG: hypothetical protein U0802_12990 [Candidatus Binatia bacterium]
MSLNAPDDDLRRALMPVNRAMPLALRRALDAYPFARKSWLMVEYVLLRDVNDSPSAGARRRGVVPRSRPASST